jgi:hypothetical protein
MLVMHLPENKDDTLVVETAISAEMEAELAYLEEQAEAWGFDPFDSMNIPEGK